MLRISLDVEGVLSNTKEAAYERSDILEPPLPQQWEFPTEEEYDEYMHVSQNLWHNHYEEIPPMESWHTLHQVTYELSKTHQVDIVTHRHNVDEQIKEWLDLHDVVYDNFHSPVDEKDELDYDIYVDDKPALAERIAEDPERVIYLRDQPHNRHVDVSRERVERVESLEEVLFWLTDHYTLEWISDLTAASERTKV